MKDRDQKKSNLSKLAGSTIKELLSEYDSLLFRDYLPFIDKYVFDHQNGGFKCNTTYSGKSISTTKRTWYDARGVWVYSYLHQYLRQDPHYLSVAKETLALLFKVNDDIQALWPWAYGEKGEVISGYEPDIYGNLFVAEGLAMYSLVTQREEDWEKAKRILMHCKQRYDNPNYTYRLEYAPDPAFQRAEIILGHWMIMLRVCTTLLRAKEDKEVQTLADQCIDSLIHKHYRESMGLMIEVLDKDFKPVSGPMSQFVYIGHAIESLWMLMDEAKRRKDESLFDVAAQRFKRHVQVAWDDVYQGVFHCLDNVEENKWLLDKVLWAQHEVSIGLLILIVEKQDPWAIQFFGKMHHYVTNHFQLRTLPYQPWKIGGDRHIQSAGAGSRIENYHHPRYLMLSIQLLTLLL